MAKASVGRDRIEFDLTIDENDLGRYWFEQPVLYFQYATQLADARQELELLKAELDLVRAELDAAIRANPDGFDIAKVTESAVAAAISTQEEYQKALRMAQKAKHVVDVLGAAVSALDHRKSALENAVKLRLANYFAEPQEPDGSKDMIDEERKRMVRHGRNRAHKG